MEQRDIGVNPKQYEETAVITAHSPDIPYVRWSSCRLNDPTFAHAWGCTGDGPTSQAIHNFRVFGKVPFKYRVGYVLPNRRHKIIRAENKCKTNQGRDQPQTRRLSPYGKPQTQGNDQQ